MLMEVKKMDKEKRAYVAGFASAWRMAEAQYQTRPEEWRSSAALEHEAALCFDGWRQTRQPENVIRLRPEMEVI